MTIRSARDHRLFVLAIALAFVLGISKMSAAAPIAWIPFDSWTTDATSGSVPFRGGTIAVEIQPDSGLGTGGRATSGFATNSPTYSNIDSIPYLNLFIKPDVAATGNPWSVEFDLVGTTLTSSDAFNVGQLFVSRASGPQTELTISVFEADDTTPFPLSDLLFEQHARASPGFGVPLIWDDSTGVLRVTSPVTTSENSQYAFFKPSVGEIGRIVVSATTIPAANGDTIDFAFAVPEPGTGLLVMGGVLALALRRRPR